MVAFSSTEVAEARKTSGHPTYTSDLVRATHQHDTGNTLFAVKADD